MVQAGESDYGPAVAQQGWRGTGSALGAVVVILALSLAVATGVGELHDILNQSAGPRAYAAGELEAMTTERLSLYLLSFQACVIGLTLLAARWVNVGRHSLVSFARPAGGAGLVVAAVVGLLAVAMLLAAVLFVYDRPALYNDIGPYSTMLHTRSWWMLVLAAAIGAPLAEEIMFRGYLYGVLRTSPLGLTGSALLTSAMWAALHPGYSIYGIGSIFLIGLYLTLLRERTGSLAVPVVCHAAYNGLITFLLAFALHGPITA